MLIFKTMREGPPLRYWVNGRELYKSAPGCKHNLYTKKSTSKRHKKHPNKSKIHNFQMSMKHFNQILKLNYLYTIEFVCT